MLLSDIPPQQQQQKENGSDSIFSADEFVSAYCFISHDKVNLIPVTTDNVDDEDEDGRHNGNNITAPHITINDLHHETIKDHADFTPDKLYLKNKNLLYSLNNPSISDVEVENSNSNNNNTTTNGSSIPSTSKDSYSPSPSSSPSSSSLSTPSLNNNTNKKTPVVVAPSIFLPKLIINLADNLNNDFKELKQLLIKIFPAWDNVDNISLNQLTGGITNMLLSCEYSGNETTKNKDGDSEPVLIRVYGHGTNLIIDRHREFISHLILNSIGLAPPVFARFKNGLVYGYLDGRSLKPEEMSQNSLYPLIAQQLGNLHNKVDYKLIEQGIEKIRALKLGRRRRRSSSASITFKKKHHHNSSSSVSNSSAKKKFISNIWELLDDWINIVPINPDLIESFQQNLSKHSSKNDDIIIIDQDNLKDIIKQEFEWLHNELTKSINSPIVSSHCDLLSGNIIIPQNFKFDDKQTLSSSLPSIENNPIKFIDYEYMLPAPRAFDIANHLAEWQGFNCDRSAIPEPSKSNPVLINWCRGYLNDMNASQEIVEQLIDEIKAYYGLPGFYWGIWAMIQSELSNIDFNYSNYGKLRLEEYWQWKHDYLKTK
ncbi:choline kinase, putative [Candida dubliniensis CD36]|uniref:ethanolamine kinase n=1 Tax=Candida dubliniensis (strain CD36 / ATCC MYA-646 / CBS 7987 / NCPF 3949 / NRRL Y-17841) TaxID=573826 RepID=B9WK18_CANDC|nr:choline kinase, putative [Candida dubliniensis CD36]CAX40669.1 choline kinase, putative [Candida dubliniensis CD36]